MYRKHQNRLVQVFEDTQRYYNTDEYLKLAVENSRINTVLHAEGNTPEVSEENYAGRISVTKERTFECALRLRKQYPDQKIAVLNFASAVSPGGGVLNGSKAQEESLCRCSTLYPALAQEWLQDAYYLKNRGSHNQLHTDDCIWTGDVVICKSDDGKWERLKQQDMISVDVLTCAAPNLRGKAEWYTGEKPLPGITEQEQYEIHLKRARHILAVASHHQDRILVLGAFGCGAFGNDPKAVAEAYRDALKEMRTMFEETVFAVYCREDETENYEVFAETLK